MLNKCKLRRLHFAWDRYEDGPKVLPKFRLFRKVWEQHRKWDEHSIIVYTIVNFDTTPEQDLERIYKLRELGYWAYVMVYDKEHCTDNFYKDLDAANILKPALSRGEIQCIGATTLEEYRKYIMKTNHKTF